MPSLEAIRYSRGSLALLDQRLLPAATEYAAIADANAGHDAIKCVRACVRATCTPTLSCAIGGMHACAAPRELCAP